MSKVICCSASYITNTSEEDTYYYALYSSPTRHSTNVGNIAPSLFDEIRRMGLVPSFTAWDFATIALSVAAADEVVPRQKSADGWTRMIDLSVSLLEPEKWQPIANELESLFRFLTGDFWTVHFTPNGVAPPNEYSRRNFDVNCISLLSGGADSLTGAIDLVNNGKKPLLVSRVVRGDSEAQRRFAREIVGEGHHCQWSCTINRAGGHEPSTRARSLIFFAFAVLAASANDTPTIVVPENGFISLNIPLSPGRIGSLSTKTTHPVYMAGIQTILDSVGIKANLLLPYRYKTKGEMLLECKDQVLLRRLIGDSISCGKYRRHKLTHCGTCVPCMVRRAAFLKSGIKDSTGKGYLHEKLDSSCSEDVSAAAQAYLRYQSKGVRSVIGGGLSFAKAEEKALFESVVARGLDEIGMLLESHGVI